MTVSTTSSAIICAANGSNSYQFPFIGVSALYISVIYTTTTGTQTTVPTTAYTVSLNSPVTGQIWGYGGTISPVTPANYASGTLTITRTLPLTQSADVSNQGNQYPIVTEQALDLLCMENQQTAARTGSWRGPWSTNTIYNFGDIVVDGINGANTTNWYSCNNANTSGVWATDLAAGDWSLILNLQSIANPGTVAAGGDLTGNYPSPTIAKIQGVTVAGVSGTGNVLLATALASTYAALASPTGTGTATWPNLVGSTSIKLNGSPVFDKINVVLFTSSGPYTPTTGMVFCIVRMVGGGGGGAGVSSTANSVGGGGGSGGYIEALETATNIGASQTITIGASGAAGASGGGTGGAGGTTSVGSLLSCTGGSGGNYNSSYVAGGGGGVPTVTTGAALVSMTGQAGASGGNLNTAGGGGSNPMGYGAPTITTDSGTSVVGTAGTGYGAGGSGAVSKGTAEAGGAGTKGYVVITEFLSA